MKYCISAILLISYLGISAQGDAVLSIDVSADTIYMENAFRIQYTVQNGSADGFQTPEMNGFDLLQGPSRSSSMSFINGVKSSEESFTYYFRPTQTGTFNIPAFDITIEGNVLKSNSPNIVIVPNPDNLFQDPNTGQIEGRPLPQKKKSTKRKRFKI